MYDLAPNNPIDWRRKMKPLLMSVTAAVLMTLAATSSIAVECAEGARHAGCVGREGAVEVRKPVAEPAREVVVEPKKEVVVAPGKAVEDDRCRIVDGRRVCR
jgi:hypothetical protein